jgi:transcriptional regulator with XRE-family HTH domain
MNENVTTVTTENAILGVVLARLREDMHPPLRQQEVADALEVSPSAWSRVEKGDSELSALQLWRLTAILDVKADHVFELANQLKSNLMERGVQIKPQSVWREIGAGKAAVSSAAAIGALAQHGIIPVVGPVLAGLAAGLWAAKSDKKKTKKR